MISNGSLITILQYLRESGPMTRRSLSGRIRLSMSMVSKLTSELSEDGLICEVGRSESISGRPSDLLALNPQAGYAIGLDIEGNRQRGVLVNLVGSVVAVVEERKPLSASREEILNLLSDLIRRILMQSDIGPEQVLGVGAALWASVDPLNGVVYSWTETPEFYATWKDFPLRDALQQRCSFPIITVDDVVRTMGLAEVLYGSRSARGQDFIYALADTGIGIAFMLAGVPYVGPSQLAGELGHIPVPGATRQCSCGSYGCLETVSSSTAVLEKARAKVEETAIETVLRGIPGFDLAHLIAAAESGDKLAYQILTEAGEHFGGGLAITLNILGSRRVVVGGSLSHSTVYMDAARRMIRLQALMKVTSGLVVESSVLNDLAGARGAASQVLNIAFSPGKRNILSLLQRQ